MINQKGFGLVGVLVMIALLSLVSLAMMETMNVALIQSILKRVSIPIQLGGGIRNADTAKIMLDIGIDRVIFGTSVAGNPDLAKSLIDQFGDRCIIGIDAKSGLVAVSGWVDSLQEPAVEFAQRMEGLGAGRIIFTDIARDGMLSGINTQALLEMLNAVKIPVIASVATSCMGHINMWMSSSINIPYTARGESSFRAVGCTC